MQLISYLATDPGRVRLLNEDSVRVVPAPARGAPAGRGTLLVVADGMGGHDAGEVASEQAVTTIVDAYFRLAGSAAVALTGAIEEANWAIFRRASEEARKGMGTTVVAAAFVDGLLHIAHVGDSRLYLIRKGRIEALTEDHSLVAEQINAGLITEEEAERHPHRNVISRAVGTSPTVEVELAARSPLLLEEGDIVVLCSDGLTEHLRAADILRVVQGHPREQAAAALIEAANEAGGMDNITAIVAFAEPDGAAQAATLPYPALRDEAVGRERRAAPPPAPADSSRGWAPMLALLLLLVMGGSALLWWMTRDEPALLPLPAASPAVVTASPATPTLLAAPFLTLDRFPRPLTVTRRLPVDGRQVTGPQVNFEVEIRGLADGELPRLRLSRERTLESMQGPAAGTMTPTGDPGRFAIALTRPPDGVGELWYWTFEIVAADEPETRYLDPELRSLNWKLP